MFTLATEMLITWGYQRIITIAKQNRTSNLYLFVFNKASLADFVKPHYYCPFYCPIYPITRSARTSMIVIVTKSYYNVRKDNKMKIFRLFCPFFHTNRLAICDESELLTL